MQAEGGERTSIKQMTRSQIQTDEILDVKTTKMRSKTNIFKHCVYK